MAQTGGTPGAAARSVYQAVVNLAPVASNVSFSGTLAVGQTLTGSYDYADNEGDADESTFQWYRADDASGTGQEVISGATSLTYVLIQADESKYISFEISPAAETGASPGVTVMSAYQGAIAFVCGASTMKDDENNVYPTILLGTQCWMAQNLNIGNYVTTATPQTDNSTIEKYCYNNIEANCAIYGGLYQWDELMQYVVTEGTQGICPDGWHVPTNGEWSALIAYVKTVPAYLCNSNVNYEAKALAGTTTDWESSANTCAVGNNVSANNATGFNALPGGRFVPANPWSGVGIWAVFSTSTQVSTTQAWSRYIEYANAYVQNSGEPKTRARSVRCLKNE